MANQQSSKQMVKPARKAGRPSHVQQGLAVLSLYRKSPIDLEDHPLAKLPSVDDEARKLFGTNPLRRALLLKGAVGDALRGSAAALDGVPSQVRLRAFLLALAEGQGPTAASAAAHTSREHGSRKLMKLSAAYVWRALEERFH